MARKIMIPTMIMAVMALMAGCAAMEGVSKTGDIPGYDIWTARSADANGLNLGTTLVQSMQYGTPLSEAMRVLSAEMRQETLNRFEAKAARLGVLLTVPMIVFILPCVFLVVGGPAAVQVLHLTR